MRTKAGVRTKWVDEVHEADVLVVGGGLAAASAAIEAKKRLGDQGSVVLVDKGRVGSSGQSAFAAAVFSLFDPDQDDFHVWMDETVRQGEYLNDQFWIEKQFNETLPAVLDIEEWGLNRKRTVFVRDENGHFERRRSRGHIQTSHILINTHDAMETIRREMLSEGVIAVEHTMATDLIAVDGTVQGVVGLNHITGNLVLVLAPVTVVAASGSGFKSVYFGHKALTGDMQAAAMRLGAEVLGMEMYAGNTTCRNFDVHGLNLYVSIGGQFINNEGDAFLNRYQPEHGSRANLQHVLMAFCREVQAGRGPIKLDMTRATEEDRKLARRMLPDTFMVWDRSGVDPFDEPIEWIVAPHPGLFSGGGLRIDLSAETSIKNLFAAGDITNTPVHGTYAYGGLNLPFCVVSGREAGKNAALRVQAEEYHVSSPNDLGTAQAEAVENIVKYIGKRSEISIEEVTQAIQETVLPYEFAYIKQADRLESALERISEIQNSLVPSLGAWSAHDVMKVLEVRSMAEVAEAMILASLARTESRGFHFREEFPMTNNKDWLKWIVLRRQSPNGALESSLLDVPTPFVQPSSEFSDPPGTIQDSYERV